MSTIETLIADAVARRATAERERAAAREREQAEQRRRIVANCADDLARSLGAEIMAALDGAIVAEEGGREVRLAFAVGGRQFTLVRQGLHSFRLVDVTGGQGAQHRGRSPDRPA